MSRHSDALSVFAIKQPNIYKALASAAGEAERDFAERMYVYHYRLFDRYQMDVVSL